MTNEIVTPIHSEILRSTCGCSLYSSHNNGKKPPQAMLALKTSARRLPRQTVTYSQIQRHASTSTSGNPLKSARTALSATVLLVSSTLVTFYYLDSRSALHRYGVMPLVRATMDPEDGHKFAVKVLASGFGPRDLVKDDSDKLGVDVSIFGLFKLNLKTEAIFSR